MRMNSNAPGPKALRRWMTDSDLSSKELAAKMDTDPRNISRWRRGVVNPCGDTRIMLEQLSGGLVPATVWMRTQLSCKAA